MVANDDKSIEELKHKLEKLAQGSWLQCFTKRFAWCNLAVYLLIYLLPIIPLWIIEYRAYIFLSGVRMQQIVEYNFYSYTLIYIVLISSMIVSSNLSVVIKTNLMKFQNSKRIYTLASYANNQLVINQMAFIISILFIPILILSLNGIHYFLPELRFALRCFPYTILLLSPKVYFAIDIIYNLFLICYKNNFFITPILIAASVSLVIYSNVYSYSWYLYCHRMSDPVNDFMNIVLSIVWVSCMISRTILLRIERRRNSEQSNI